MISILRKAEEQLKNNAWIKDAELFFDNHQILHVNISEREPVARVFTISGQFILYRQQWFAFAGK